jgi:hypothetical protein
MPHRPLSHALRSLLLGALVLVGGVSVGLGAPAPIASRDGRVDGGPDCYRRESGNSRRVAE